MKKMTLKSILKSIEGIQVEAKKPRYTKKGNSRKYIITGMPATSAGSEILESLLDICQSHGGTVEYSESGDLALRFRFQSWPVLESEILKDIDLGEETSRQEKKKSVREQLFEFHEKEIDGLGIGMNVTSLGIAFASNEEDLKNLKAAMKAILTEMYKG